MRVVSGHVDSRRPISLEKASTIVSRFAAFNAKAARPEIAAHLRRASKAFKELVQFHKEFGIRSSKVLDLEAFKYGKEDTQKEKKRLKTKETKAYHDDIGREKKEIKEEKLENEFWSKHDNEVNVKEKLYRGEKGKKRNHQDSGNMEEEASNERKKKKKRKVEEG